VNAIVKRFPEESVQLAERVRQHLLKAHSPHKPWPYAWGVRVLNAGDGELGVELRTWVGCGVARVFQAGIEVHVNDVLEIERGTHAAAFHALLAGLGAVHTSPEAARCA